MIQVGSTLKLNGCNGTAKIIRKSNGGNYFWAKIDWPSFRYNGEQFPFANDGKYIGSSAWQLPNLVVTAPVSTLVEEEF